MAGLTDYAIDNGLGIIDDSTNGADQLTICSADPLTYAQAVAGSPDVSFMLGSKNFGANGAAVGAPFTLSPDVGGRWISTTAITSGSPGTFSLGGTASFYALVDTVHARLLAHGPLGASTSVNAGDTFTLPSFNIHQPNT